MSNHTQDKKQFWRGWWWGYIIGIALANTVHVIMKVML